MQELINERIIILQTERAQGNSCPLTVNIFGLKLQLLTRIHTGKCWKNEYLDWPIF